MRVDILLFTLDRNALRMDERKEKWQAAVDKPSRWE
jgi:hypothetical protein